MRSLKNRIRFSARFFCGGQSVVVIAPLFAGLLILNGLYACDRASNLGRIDSVTMRSDPPDSALSAARADTPLTQAISCFPNVLRPGDTLTVA